MIFNGVFHVNENMNDLLGKNQAKAYEEVPVEGVAPDTVRHTAVPGIEEPTTTTDHTETPGCWSNRVVCRC